MGGLASSVGSMVGIGGSSAAQGLNWSPSGAPLLNPVNNDQLSQAYTQSQTGINNQAAFLSALQAQNGIANQSSVYNQLQNVANGQGPNPAQAMLNQATGANNASTAALMAGQRGAGQNTGLIARQAAQQGAANQQNAIGQGATMQANQSLGALNTLGGLSSQQVGQQAAATGALTGAQQSEQQLLLGSAAAQNNALVSQQNSMNSQNLSQAQGGAKAQAGVLQGIGGAFGMAHGGAVPHYANAGWVSAGPTVGGAPDPAIWNQPRQTAYPESAPMPKVEQPSAAPSAPPGPTKFAKATATALGQGSTNSNDPLAAQEAAGKDVGMGVGKGLSALGSAIGGLFGSSSQGITATGEQAPEASNQSGDMSSSQMDMSGIQGGGAAGGMEFAKGGKVPAMVSPGEVYLPPEKVQKIAKGKASPLDGEKIKGKAKVKGDSLKNDIVPKTLEEGGIVLPRSVMQAKHPHWEAHKFVSAIMAKEGLKGKK